MSKHLIPGDFLDLAKIAGVPESIASNFWTRISGKKGYQDLVSLLAKELDCNEREARKVFISLKDLYRKQQSEKILGSIENRDFMQEAIDGFEAVVGKMRKVKSATNAKKKIRTVIVASDLHIPFANDAAIAQLLSEEADDLYLLGDLFDMYGASSYRSTIDHLTVRAELAMGRVFMEEISKKFKKIKVIKGNHDLRATKRIQEFAPQILPLIVDPIELVSQGLPNVEILSTPVPGTAPNTEFGQDHSMSYMGVDGDLVLGHFENFYGKDAGIQVANWLGDWEHILKLEAPKVIMQAHVHRLGVQYTPKGQVIMTTGCLCRPMPYQIEGHGKYQPPTNGYIILQRESGKTLIDQTRIVHITS